MTKPQVRAGQLITTFGPGAMLDLPEGAVIISGTDGWSYNKSLPLPTVTEPRLQAKLAGLTGNQNISLRKPPAAIEANGYTPDIVGYRFPEWFIVQNIKDLGAGLRSRRLVHLNDLQKGKFIDDDRKPHTVVPVRFVRACPHGHVGDIDWFSFVHDGSGSCRRELHIDERGTSGDLNSIAVRCACGARKDMSAAASMETHALGRCDGSRPWLGPNTRESCNYPNKLLIRSASNAYFSQSLSVISIPDTYDAIDRIVASLWDSHLSAVQTEEQLAFTLTMRDVKERLSGYTADEIMAALQRRRSGAGTEGRPVKEAEFDALSQAEAAGKSQELGDDFLVRTLPPDRWASKCMKSVSRVAVVHRLREVVALVGFTRFEAAGPDTDGELAMDVKRAPIGLDSSWLPAIENRGEGIFIQFDPAAISQWLERGAVKARDKQLQDGLAKWRADHRDSARTYPGLAYYMLHSLAHMLLISISLECGYPASSLRERVYAMSGRYGILVYTGSPDAEGTLGGLADEGQRIKMHMERALEIGRLCSNDPICAFHDPMSLDNQQLLGSACHGCLLISETSCEQRNDFLDRALVVATVEELGAEFFGVSGV